MAYFLLWPGLKMFTTTGISLILMKLYLSFTNPVLFPMLVLTVPLFLCVTECHNKKKKCKCHCGSISYVGYNPHKCSATHFTTSVMPVHAVCVGT